MSSQNKPHIDHPYPLSALTGKLIAAAQAAHREFGPGFEEVVYQRSLALEMGAHDLEFEREVSIDIRRGKGEDAPVVALCCRGIVVVLMQSNYANAGK